MAPRQLEALAREARMRANHRDGLSPEKRRRIIDTIKVLSAAGAKTSGALAIYLQRARYAPDPEIVEALDGDPARAAARTPAAAFEAEKRAHPPPPAAAPSKQPDGGFKAALLIAGGLALLLALVTCGARPAPAAEADSPGWRFTEAVDGDTLAFAVPALPAPLSRVLVRVRGVDTPETRHPKCKAERAAAERARAFTAAALEDAGAIVLTGLKWGKYGGRMLAAVHVDGVDLADALIGAGHGRAYDGGRRVRGAAA